MGHKVAAIGGKLSHVVGGAPHVDTSRVREIASSEVGRMARDRIVAAAEAHPIELHDSIQTHREAPSVAAPVASAPITIQHVDAAPRTFFGLRYQRTDGSWTCERVESQDSCTSRCTSMLQQASLTGAGPSNCSCLEDAPNC